MDDPVLIKALLERDALRAEVEMLRGVGCGEDGDGPCGACRKCAREERDALRLRLAEVERERDDARRVAKRLAECNCDPSEDDEGYIAAAFRTALAYEVEP